MGGTQVEFKYDPPLTEHGKKGAHEAGLKIKREMEELGYGDCPVKVISSPLLRTLQTAAQVSFAITGTSDLPLVTHEYLSVKLKSGLKMNPLEHGALAQYERDELISRFLDKKVGSVVPDHLNTLPKL